MVVQSLFILFYSIVFFQNFKMKALYNAQFCLNFMVKMLPVPGNLKFRQKKANSVYKHFLD